ncbi:hypothetical protein HDU67_001394, partial [Dinochytrium kinnereticum]
MHRWTEPPFEEEARWSTEEENDTALRINVRTNDSRMKADEVKEDGSPESTGDDVEIGSRGGVSGKHFVGRTYQIRAL